MNHIVEFWYPGPYCNIPDDNEEAHKASKRLDDAYDKITAALTIAGLPWKHEYMWPDGSLYLMVEHDGDREAVRAAVSKAIETTGCSVAEVCKGKS